MWRWMVVSGVDTPGIPIGWTKQLVIHGQWAKRQPWFSWWRHQMETFSALLAISAGNPVNSPHKGHWRGALIFSFICVLINSWVNNREAGDLRRYRAHYDVIVMSHDILNINPYVSHQNVLSKIIKKPIIDIVIAYKDDTKWLLDKNWP